MMGGHYGSVQVRAEDRAKVRGVAERVAKAMKIRMLVGPVMGGWVGIYPENHGQDDAVGREVARQAGGYVLQAMVHDDDVMAYWFYEGGRLVDSYWSAPGYFGEENRTAEEAMVGNTEVFRPLVGERVGEMAALLRRGERGSAFESERLAKVAKLLGIVNAVQAFEYLQEGERAGVKGWREFEEISAAGEKVEKKRAASFRPAMKAALKKLERQGVLLLHEERKGLFAFGCTLEAAGFMVVWGEFLAQPPTVLAYEAPWKEGKGLEVGTVAWMTAAASDAAGRRTAIAGAKGVQIWDSLGRDPVRIAEVIDDQSCMAISMTADGKRIVHATRRGIVISEAASGATILRVPAEGARTVAVHPSGAWAVAAGKTLGVISVEEEPHWRDVFIGGQSHLEEEMLEGYLTRLAGADAEEWARRHAVDSEREGKALREQGERTKDPALSEANVDKAMRVMGRIREQMKERLVALQRGGRPLFAVRGNEPVVSVGFSGDGRWLFCSTEGGVRVYAWDEFPRGAGAAAMSPKWRFDIPRDGPEDRPRHIHGMAEDVGTSALLFSYGATIHRLDLGSGRMDVLLEMPRALEAYRLMVPVDGAELGVLWRESPTWRGRNISKPGNHFLNVWSLAQLRAGAARK